jgi:hypothetical protein
MPIVLPIIHGVINLAGWAMCLTGVIFASVSKSKNKLKVHMSLELVGALLMITSAILGMFLTFIHAFIAIGAIVLLAMGVGGGMYYKSIKPASGETAAVEKKKSFRNMHINGGRLTNIVLIVVIVLGILTMVNLLTV